jgi:hypothetical protein
MISWWEVHKDQLCLELVRADQVLVEELTGRVPMLLRALLDIELNAPNRSRIYYAGAVIELNEEEDSEEEDEQYIDATVAHNYEDTAARFFDRLWEMPEFQQVCYIIQRFCLDSERQYFNSCPPLDTVSTLSPICHSEYRC